ncbi:Cytosolic Fe-S cluster assembly factor CFD1 [Smittium culicis]|uniref:Cytosolic Fe-S cluster assembly factor CFD1 n=1 Tax=Smittium culicis TaxID=133412 RepID=A0A1R1YKT6_9FUNG|nr:Cytosolic Fe-S cluster assembly factor CFD1 [Smittium culicis]
MSEVQEFSQLSRVKHIVLILSGKGGVGKSSVTIQVAMGLKQLGKRVGILDIDLCGPSIPKMLGLEDYKIHQSSSGWVPVYVDQEKTFGVMSLGFLLPGKNSSVVWRGPKKSNVHWGDIDYLLVDTPPGTSDEHLSIVEYLQGKVNLPILGVVENMSGYVCTHCAECTNIFSSGGGSKLCDKYNVDFLGSIPIDPSLAVLLDSCSTATNGHQADAAAAIAPNLDRASAFLSKYESSPLNTKFSAIAKCVDSNLTN